MIKSSIISFCFCWGMAAFAQSSSQNYVLTHTALDPDNTHCLESISYVDGLGRVVESVVKGVTPNHSDLVSLKDYTGLEREHRSWLPVPISSNGAFTAKYAVRAAARNHPLYGSDVFPFAETTYEPSALGRVVEQQGPGSAWRSARSSVTTQYGTNTLNGEYACRKYEVSATGNALVCRGLYSKGQLSVTRVQDEDGNVTLTFKDFQDHDILQRAILDGECLDTYYIYDGLGRLRYVLPPSASASSQLQTANVARNMTNCQTLRQYAYYYEYNGRGLCTSKKLPGAAAITMIYDDAGNMVFSQDGAEQSISEWRFQLYDSQQRPTVSGRFTSSSAPSVPHIVTSNFTGSGALVGYSSPIDFDIFNDVFIDNVNYFDNYDYLQILTDTERAALAYQSNIPAPYQNAFTQRGILKARGLQTGAMTYALDESGERSVSAIYYDIQDRVVQSHSTHVQGGAQSTYTAYTFTGKPQFTKTVFTADGHPTITEEYANTYDHAERLIQTNLSLNGAEPVVLSAQNYDELGRISAHSLPNGITENYTYNIRSWTTGIESDVFSENLRYETSGVTPACYGGNIASYTWSVGNGNAAVAKTFHNTYDALSRLTDVTLEAGGNTTANFCSCSYDAMGNITQLLRKGVMNDGSIGAIDDLEYTYSGNQLVRVSDDANGPTDVGAMHFQDNSDEAAEYTYDENGRLTQDLNKKISQIQYNAVSLPSEVRFDDGSYITYLYDASGRKLRVDYHISPVVPLHPGTGPTPTSIGAGTVTGRADTGEASTASIPIIGPNPPIIPIRLTHTYTEYCGNHIFENGLLTMTLIPGGYISYEGGSISAPSYHFYLCDHEGNNRIVTNINGNIEQVNDYTPFGVLMENAFTDTTNQRYKYNGKELDRMHGLDLYDYGARLYDAPLGRWTAIDPLCEKYYSWSPYVYCYDNPIRYIDPNGDSIAVLNVRSEHLALLIQDKNKQWKYYSVNGNNVYISGYFSGGRKFDDLGDLAFQSPAQFLKSENNKEGDRQTTGYKYVAAFVIPTSEKQDNIIREEFIRISTEECYSLNPLSPNHCATAVQRSLNKAGIETREDYIVPAMSQFQRPTYLRKNPYFPSAAYKAIIKNNPNGYEIKR